MSHRSCRRGISGLDLGSYTALRRGGSIAGTQIVVPEDPCASTLVSKLGRIPAFGSRMPFNGPPYFTAEEVQPRSRLDRRRRSQQLSRQRRCLVSLSLPRCWSLARSHLRCTRRTRARHRRGLRARAAQVHRVSRPRSDRPRADECRGVARDRRQDAPVAGQHDLARGGRGHPTLPPLSDEHAGDARSELYDRVRSLSFGGRRLQPKCNRFSLHNRLHRNLRSKRSNRASPRRVHPGAESASPMNRPRVGGR